MKTPARGAGLTVGSLRGVPMVATRGGSTRPSVLLPLAPARRRGCCGTGCVGCAYGAWVRRLRTLGAGPSGDGG